LTQHQPVFGAYAVTSHQRIKSYGKVSTEEHADALSLKQAKRADLGIARGLEKTEFKPSNLNSGKTTGRNGKEAGMDMCHIEAHNEVNQLPLNSILSLHSLICSSST
jgi:hypothetical protein